MLDSAKKIQPHQFGWIVNAARDHFRAQIEKVRLQIVVREKFPDRVPHTTTDLDPATREKDHRSQEEFLEAYTNIVEFLIRLQDVITYFEAERFAEDIAVSFGFKKTRNVTKKGG